MKRTHRTIFAMTTSILAGLTSLLGLGSCRTPRTAIDEVKGKESERIERNEREKSDSIRHEIDKERIGHARLLYGVPPTRYIEKAEIESIEQHATDTNPTNE